MPTRISEIKVVRITDCEYTNPVYLRWINQYGGRDFYLFQRTQEKKTETVEKGIYYKTIEDFESATEKVKSLGKDFSESWTLGAEMIDQNDYDGILGITTSPLAEMWVSDSVWMTVVVKDGSWSKTTYNQRHSIEFEIIQPKRNASW